MFQRLKDNLNIPLLRTRPFDTQVSARFSLGTELATQFGPQVPGGKVGMHSVAARYEGRCRGQCGHVRLL